ncbi:MAG: RNA-binding cell elongation regulator Jag/EloR [Desulfovibrio sp.]|uniref:RNA-binding cell elongation regulator Jag/EloR n=1 Tax=Desulfovibrio sp. 7SRBS1 TaxID=3378064 RepID=UPI003B3F8D05
MSGYKEFTGKNLDEAIQQACAHFELQRNKLEIEIVSGGSSGIFGLVGKKKAIVKARPRAAVSTENGAQGAAESQNGRNGQKNEAGGRNRSNSQRNSNPAPKKSNNKPVPRKNTSPAPRKEAQTPAVKPDSTLAVTNPVQSVGEESPADRQPLVDPRAKDFEIPSMGRPSADTTGNAGPTLTTTLQEKPLENPALHKLIHTAVTLMIEPIVGTPPVHIYQTPDRIKVLIDDDDQAGLLIGREGQTLNAMQYLVNRIVAKQWEEPLKVQIDAGQYRERQDDKLRQLAFFLADKVKANGRPQSTKPLSSYHRRVVHLALQNDEEIATRSKGEGPLKRVLILPKRENNRAQR